MGTYWRWSNCTTCHVVGPTAPARPGDRARRSRRSRWRMRGDNVGMHRAGRKGFLSAAARQCPGGGISFAGMESSECLPPELERFWRTDDGLTATERARAYGIDL